MPKPSKCKICDRIMDSRVIKRHEDAHIRAVEREIASSEIMGRFMPTIRRKRK